MSDSIHMKCLEAVQDVIQDLDLEDIDDDHVVVISAFKNSTRETPFNFLAYFDDPPGVLLTPAGIEEVEAENQTRTRILYPVNVVFFDSSAEGTTADADATLDKRLLWRQQTYQALHNHNITLEGGSVATSICRFGRVLLESQLVLNRWVSVLNVGVREELNRDA